MKDFFGPLFYEELIGTDVHSFSKEESKHILHVLRMKEGDKLSITDGKGQLAHAHLLASNSKIASAKISELHFVERNHVNRLHLVLAPTKNMSRMEWLIEKMVEIGADSFTPIFCEHSERKNMRIDRLEKIAVAALKQSHQAYLPEIREAVSFKDFIAGINASDGKFIAHCDAGTKKSFETVKHSQENYVMVGPEGDFSPKEIEEATKLGFQPISLGPTRLRTETAGLLACMLFNQKNAKYS